MNRADQHPFRPLVIPAILLAAVAMRVIRGRLVGIADAAMAPWAGQVIFGFYFANLAFAIQALQARFDTHQPRQPRQALLLLVLISVCADIVLVNIQEISATLDASYGLVVIWDIATFFAWFRVIDLCRPGEATGSPWAWTVAGAPLFKLGREILFLPYEPFSVRAYLDLVCGDILVCAWVFIALGADTADARSPSGGQSGRWLPLVVFTGCVYWGFNSIENLLVLAYQPFEAVLAGVMTRLGLPPYALSVIYFLTALTVALGVRRANAFKLGDWFGLTPPRETSAAA